MIALVSFDRSQLGSKLVDDKGISSISVIVVEDDGMTKVQGVGEEIMDREDVSDLSFGVAVNIITEEDRGLLEVGSLSRGVAEVLNDATVYGMRCIT